MEKETPYDPAWELYQKTRSDELKKSDSLRQKMMNDNPLVDRPAIDSPPTLTSRIETLEYRLGCLEDTMCALSNNLEFLRRQI